MPEDTSRPDAAHLGDAFDWEVMARYLSGESSPEESGRVRSWLEERPDDEALLSALDRIIAKMPSLIPGDIDVEAALERVRERRDNERVRPFMVRDWRPRSRTPHRWTFPVPLLAAAATVLVIITGWLAFRGRESVTPVAFTPRGYATGIGGRDSVRLPDGSLMILGPASFASVAANFGTAERRVDIRGDAYFDIVHNTSSPFVVRAGPATVRDVGTRFAVRSDSVEGVVVAVTQGAVSLSAAGYTGNELLLQAGQRGTVRPERPPERRGIASDADLDWMRGRLVFRESPMSEVVASLRRWYGLDLRFEDQSFATRHITAIFSGEPPERVIEVIRLALGAEIQRRGDTIVVRSARTERGGPRSK